MVWLLQHLARSQKNLGKKRLLVTDSMSVTLALSKGRSSCRAMNRICRQIAVLERALKSSETAAGPKQGALSWRKLALLAMPVKKVNVHALESTNAIHEGRMAARKKQRGHPRRRSCMEISRCTRASPSNRSSSARQPKGGSPRCSKLAFGQGHFQHMWNRVVLWQRPSFVQSNEVLSWTHVMGLSLISPRGVSRYILKLLRSGKIAYVWLGTPCNRWSRSRRNDGRGPGPLRDDREFLMGLPNLNDKATAKVHLVNILRRFSAKVFPTCLSYNIPVALENHHTSRIWLAKSIQHLLHHKRTITMGIRIFVKMANQFGNAPDCCGLMSISGTAFDIVKGLVGFAVGPKFHTNNLLELKVGNFSLFLLNHIPIEFVIG